MSRKQDLIIRKKAFTLLEVLQQTGKLDLVEAHRRCYPNQNENSHAQNAERDMLGPKVYEEFCRMLKIDDAAVKNLGPGTIIKGLLEDMKKIDVLINSYDTDADTLTKLMNSKTQKQKLLGSYLGMWQADKEEKKDEDPNATFNKLKNFMGKGSTKKENSNGQDGKQETPEPVSGGAGKDESSEGFQLPLTGNERGEEPAGL